MAAQSVHSFKLRCAPSSFSRRPDRSRPQTEFAGDLMHARPAFRRHSYVGHVSTGWRCFCMFSALETYLWVLES